MSAIAETEVLAEPRVTRITVPNPGPKTLTGTQTYVVGASPAYIIDPGPALESHLANLLEWLDRRDINLAAILLTHAHPDHAPAAPLLSRQLRAPILASLRMEDAEAARLGATRRLLAGESLPVGDERLVVLETPGHTPDHLSFWLPSARVLFTGDVILGQGTTLVAPPEGDMTDYMRTLEHLRALRPALIAPGHGPIVTDPASRIDAYAQHRRQRERQVLEALSAKPLDPAGIVTAVYHDLPMELRHLAAGSVEAQLVKLEREGKIRREGQRFRLTAESVRRLNC